LLLRLLWLLLLLQLLLLQRLLLGGVLPDGTTTKRIEGLAPVIGSR